MKIDQSTIKVPKEGYGLTADDAFQGARHRYKYSITSESYVLCIPLLNMHRNTVRYVKLTASIDFINMYICTDTVDNTFEVTLSTGK